MDAKLLRLLIERAQSVRDDAVKVAAKADRERAAAAQTLQTLTDYRDESIARGPLRPGQQCNTDQLRIAGQFDARLVVAIQQQSGQHALKAQHAQTRQAQVMQAQQRLKAFETIAQRRADRELVRQNRREQRLLDEYASDLNTRKHSRDTAR